MLETWSNSIAIHDLEAAVVREIQAILEVQITGICCGETSKKFADFKERNYLEHPDILGPSTALSLLESLHKHEISEQNQNIPTDVNLAAGSRTGRSVVIPGEGLVYEHQHIIPGVPLTWGEMTKGLDTRRIPSSKGIVDNIISLAKVFGIARAKYGKAVAITSGYRPASLGIGASRSQHILGKALDSFPLDKSDINLWYNILRATPGVMGLGDAANPNRGGFVHADIRNEKWQVRFGY